MADEDEPRRNPRKLQDVLNFCTEISAKADAEGASSSSGNAVPPALSEAVASMDPESKKYLSAAFDHLLMDVPKKITSYLHILATSPNLQEPMDDCNDEILTLERLLDLIEDHPDNANIVVNLGGLSVLLSCVDSCNVRVQEEACTVLGSMCQNNPKCQDEMLGANGALLKLLRVVDSSETHSSVRTKALFAISCTVRNHRKAAEKFVEMDGLSYLMRAMQAADGALYLKAIFLISALTEDYEPCIAQLVSMGYTDLLVESLVVGPRSRPPRDEDGDADGQQRREITLSALKEHTTAALLKLCTISEESLRVCRSHDALLESLKDRLEAVQGKDEALEEREYIESLLALISQKSGPSQALDEDACR